jgi:hypothetical protein
LSGYEAVCVARPVGPVDAEQSSGLLPALSGFNASVDLTNAAPQKKTVRWPVTQDGSTNGT